MAQTDQRSAQPKEEKEGTQIAKSKLGNNARGCLTGSQWFQKKLHTLFDEVDEDNSQTVDLMECYTLVLRMYLNIAIWVALYTVPTLDDVENMYYEMDEDDSGGLDFNEFEVMAVVLFNSITSRVIAQLLLQFVMAPALATLFIGMLKEYAAFAGVRAFYGAACGFIPDILETYVLNEALAIIVLAGIMKTVLIPPVDSFLARLALRTKPAGASKAKKRGHVHSTITPPKEEKEDTKTEKKQLSKNSRNCLTSAKWFKGKLRKIFDKVDIDKSKTVDITECYAMVLTIYLNIAIWVALYTVPTHQDVVEMFETMDDDHSGGLDFDEFEIMAVVLFNSVTWRVIAQLVIQFVMAPALATLIIGMLKEYAAFAGVRAFYGAACGFIPDILLKYVFNEALAVIVLAALVKSVLIPPVDSRIGHLALEKKIK